MSATTTPAPLPGVVAFDYGLWSATYPDLAGSVLQPQATGYFGLATLYLDNTGASPVQDATPGGQRAVLLNLVVAHLAKLLAPLNGEAPSGLVGPISSASEGSVSVSVTPLSMGTSALAAWFGQTQYGAMFWAATSGLRLARYVPGPAAFRPAGGFAGYGWAGCRAAS